MATVGEFTSPHHGESVAIVNGSPAGTERGIVVYVAGGNLGATGETANDITSTAANVASVAVRASNTARKALVLTNDSYATAYVNLGAAASSTAYAFKMAPSEKVILAAPVFTGAVNAQWEVAAAGKMYAAELT